MEAQVILTEDGSHTIYLPTLDETYHSKFGAIQEALHVFINNGLAKIEKTEIKVFEMGFGSGLNALLTAVYAQKNKIKTNYTTIEKFPLKKDFISLLNYPDVIQGSNEIFLKIHKAKWDDLCEITPFLSIKKMNADIMDENIELPYPNDIIYFDAFAPSKQTDLWSRSVFLKMHKILDKNGILVTYSAAGIVKKALRESGFLVKRLAGPPGKHHMLIAQKN